MIDEVMDRKIVEIKTSDLNADIVITEREFDTDKDVDPTTGERPVSSQTDPHIVIGRRDSTVPPGAKRVITVPGAVLTAISALPSPLKSYTINWV